MGKWEKNVLGATVLATITMLVMPVETSHLALLLGLGVLVSATLVVVLVARSNAEFVVALLVSLLLLCPVGLAAAWELDFGAFEPSGWILASAATAVAFASRAVTRPRDNRHWALLWLSGGATLMLGLAGPPEAPRTPETQAATLVREAWANMSDARGLTPGTRILLKLRRLGDPAQRELDRIGRTLLHAASVPEASTWRDDAAATAGQAFERIAAQTSERHPEAQERAAAAYLALAQMNEPCLEPWTRRHVRAPSCGVELRRWAAEAASRLSQHPAISLSAGKIVRTLPDGA